MEVSRVFHQDRIQQRLVEQTDETPDISLAEKIVEKPVTQTQGITQQVVNTRVQHVVDTVKTVEVPVLQFIDKVSDIPVVALRQIPKLQHTDQVVDVPAVLVVLVPQVQVVAETAETPQLLLDAQVPHLQVVEKTVQIPQLPFVVIPEIRTAPATQSFESVNAESVHQVTQAFVKRSITDFTDVGQSVFDGTNKPSHDIADGVHVGKDDLDGQASGSGTAASTSQQSNNKPSRQHKRERKERGRKAR